MDGNGGGPGRDYLIAGLLLVAIILDLWLIRLARRFWRTRGLDRPQLHAAPAVYVFGTFSPVLTWLKYGRLPDVVLDVWGQIARRLNRARSAVMALVNGLSRPREASLYAAVLLAGVILLWNGQQDIARPGGRATAQSQWLQETFYLDIENLDQVLAGMPVLVVGGLGVLVGVRGLLLHRQGEDSLESLGSGMLPLSGLRGLWHWVLMGGAAFATVLLQLRALDARPFIVALWLACIAGAAVLAWVWDRRAHVRLSLEITRLDALWLIGLTLLGLIVATYRLQEIPNLLVLDEGTFWIYARDLHRGILRRPPFDYGVYTYPILSSYFQAFTLRVFGETFWAWRFSSVLAGVAAVTPLYLLARELFDRRVAVAAGVAMVTAPYFLAFARLGYNNIQTLFPVVLTLYGLCLGIKRGSAFYLYLAGGAAGLGFYTYTAGRSGLSIAAAFLLLELVIQPRLRRSLLKAAGVFGLGAAVVAWPLMIYAFAANPAMALEKMLESLLISVPWASNFFPESEIFAVMPPIRFHQFIFFYNPRLSAILLVRGLTRTLLAFQHPWLVGEHFLWGGLAGSQTVLLYLVGLVLTLTGLRQRRCRLLLLWFAFTVFVLSAANTFPPRHQHMVGVIPLLALWIGLGSVVMVEAVGHILPRLRARRQHVLLGALLAGAAVAGLHQYFLVVPSIYRPDLDQIIMWAGLRATDQRLMYVYTRPEESRFGPSLLPYLRTDVYYQTLSLDELAARPAWWSTRHPTIFFYSQKDAPAVMALASRQPERWQQRLFLDLNGNPIGGALYNVPFDFEPPAFAWEGLADLLRRPVRWLIIGLGGALIVVAAPFFGDRLQRGRPVVMNMGWGHLLRRKRAPTGRRAPYLVWQNLGAVRGWKIASEADTWDEAIQARDRLAAADGRETLITENRSPAPAGPRAETDQR